MIAAVAGIVSLLALMLASVGVFGVFAFIVQERTREIGIRMAIGARASQVVRLVLGSTSWATAGGLLLGLAGAVAVSRLLEGYLYGVGRFDARDVRGRRRGARGGGARRHLRARQARHARRSRDGAALRVSRG